MRGRRLPHLGSLLAALLLLAACQTGPSSVAFPARGKVSVVAIEDVWGSIARQLGGDHVTVHSLISNPNADPHDYEPTPSDARAIASAKLVITNGIGYDSWADRLLAANKVSGRSVLRIGDLVGLHVGDNPHQWYSPPAVEKVIEAVVDDYRRIDSTRAADYDRQRSTFERDALGSYH